MVDGLYLDTNGTFCFASITSLIGTKLLINMINYLLVFGKNWYFYDVKNKVDKNVHVGTHFFDRQTIT